jgi:DNA replication initiation complex subunit (GINS family)
MDGKTIVTAILSGGTTGAVVSAIWNLSLKLWLQGREERSKEKLAGIDAEFKAELARLDATFKHSQSRAQAAIDRSVFVTRAHFETEFEAMKQVFSHLSQLQIGLNGLRPMVSVETPGR